MSETTSTVTPASAPRRLVAAATDVAIAFVVLDALRLALLPRMWAGELNIWLGAVGGAWVLYLLWLRGRWLPSAGDWLVDIRRDRREAPHVRFVAGARPLIMRTVPLLVLLIAIALRLAPGIVG